MNERYDFMKSYICSVCGYLYDEESAEKNDDSLPIPFDELSDEWTCPICGVTLNLFIDASSTESSDQKKLHNKPTNFS